jgi:hypothetical protein
MLEEILHDKLKSKQIFDKAQSALLLRLSKMMLLYYRHGLLNIAIALCMFMNLSGILCAEEAPQNKIWNKLGITPLSDTLINHKTGYFAAPIVFYTPDTRWGIGISAATIFHLKDKIIPGRTTRASYLRISAHYTQQKQKDVWGEWNVFSAGEKYFFKGEFRARDFPDKFYGLGNRTSKKEQESFAYEMLTCKTMILKKIRRHLFYGIDAHYTHFYNFKREKGKKLDSGKIRGYNGGVGSALGLVAILDQRDNVMNPYSGKYVEFSSYFYRRFLGSTFSFTVINGEFRKFWQVRHKHILAFQTKARFALGDVPFIEMSQIGNDDMLRGYPRNRFRDAHMFGAQFEYRFPVFWRMGLATFAGVGDIFSRTSDIRMKSLKFTIGTGLRFLLNTAERLNVRLDYGHGSQGGYFYLAFTEAF